jgi:hypothetical protein
MGRLPPKTKNTAMSKMGGTTVAEYAQFFRQLTDIIMLYCHLDTVCPSMCDMRPFGPLFCA